MSLEEALKILEEYDEGCPPEGRESLSCGCGECAVPDGEESKDPIGVDTSVKKENSKTVKKKAAVKTTRATSTKKKRASAANKRA